jgi:uncharacterized membrane protein YkoI
MKHTIMVAAAFSLAAAVTASAQDTSRVKPKDSTKVTITTSNGVLGDTITAEWYVPTGAVCSSVDVNAAKAVSIQSDLYKPDAGMISPDSAKLVALCAVPGQIGSGKMEMADGRTTYKIDIIPNEKKTHTDVVVDANTGAVLSSKQFGGLRGLAGWVRESGEHKLNTKKPKTDTLTTVKSSTTIKSTTTVKPPL